MRPEKESRRNHVGKGNVVQQNVAQGAKTMNHGGKRTGAGRPKGAKSKKGATNVASDVTALKDRESKAIQEIKVDPLAYMLQVMNDPTADPDRRDKMAISAAQYLHKKGDRNAKAGEKLRAEKAGSGKFAQGRAPLKLIHKE